MSVYLSKEHKKKRQNALKTPFFCAIDHIPKEFRTFAAVHFCAWKLTRTYQFVFFDLDCLKLAGSKNNDTNTRKKDYFETKSKTKLSSK